MSEPRETRETEDGGRRRAINMILGGGLLTWLGAALYPVIRYLKPITQTRVPTSVTLNAKDKKKLDEKRFTIVRFGHDRVIVLRDHHGKYHAADAKCTHEGCTVQFNDEESVIWCACHNAKFDVGGRRISGPAPRSLKPFDVRVSKSGKITVQKAS